MADSNPATQLARAYARGCTELGLVPVREFIKVLNAPPSQRSAGVECRLDNLKDPLSDRDIVSIASSLQQCGFITVLDLANNNIGPGGIEHLCVALKDASMIQHVGLSNNRLGDEGLARVAQFIRETNSVKTLVLDRVNATAKGVAAIMASLSQNTSVHTLSLASNDIPPKGGHAIAQVLRLGINLRSLGLADNQLGDAGVVPISAAIAAPGCKLNELDLQRNNINGMGAGAIGEALSRGAMLRTLNLAGNLGISGDGLSNLVRSFSLSPSLQSVDLNGIAFTRNSGAALAETLGKNPPLKELKIGGMAQLALVQDLAVSMGSNITLVRCELSDKLARTEPGQRIEAICAVNRKIAGWESTSSALQQHQKNQNQTNPDNQPNNTAVMQDGQRLRSNNREWDALEQRMLSRQQKPPTTNAETELRNPGETNRPRSSQNDTTLDSTIRDINKFVSGRNGEAQPTAHHVDETYEHVRVPQHMERMFMQWMDSRQAQWEQRYEAQQEKFASDITRHEETIAKLSEQVCGGFDIVMRRCVLSNLTTRYGVV